MELWEWCDDNFAEADILPESDDVSLFVGDKPFEFVDEIVGLPGVAEILASPEVRWLTVRSEGRIIFPNLARHNGKSAKDRASEQKKKKRQRDRDAKCPDKRPDCSGTAPGPEKRREEKIEPPSGGSKKYTAEQVEQLYEAYPRKASKGQAVKAIRQALGKVQFETLLAVVQEFAASPKGKSDFCPYPATWFNGECWTDDRRAWQQSSDSGRRPNGPENGAGVNFAPGSQAEGGVLPGF